MNTVRLKVSELRTKLTENRQQHEADYQQAVDGARAENIKKLQDAIRQLKSGKPHDLDFIHIEKPESHLKDYDRVVAMLDMTQDEIVELSAKDFAQYVQDDWAWKVDFLNSTAKYRG